jgi:hypothetical protein
MSGWADLDDSFISMSQQSWDSIEEADAIRSESESESEPCVSVSGAASGSDSVKHHGQAHVWWAPLLKAHTSHLTATPKTTTAEFRPWTVISGCSGSLAKGMALKASQTVVCCMLLFAVCGGCFSRLLRFHCVSLPWPMAIHAIDVYCQLMFNAIANLC